MGAIKPDFAADLVERVGRAIAEADGEDYMEDCKRYDRRALYALRALEPDIKPDTLA